jgi:hypothetical protein
MPNTSKVTCSGSKSKWPKRHLCRGGRQLTDDARTSPLISANTLKQALLTGEHLETIGHRESGFPHFLLSSLFSPFFQCEATTLGSPPTSRRNNQQRPSKPLTRHVVPQPTLERVCKWRCPPFETTLEWPLVHSGAEGEFDGNHRNQSQWRGIGPELMRFTTRAVETQCFTCPGPDSSVMAQELQIADYNTGQQRYRGSSPSAA